MPLLTKLAGMACAQVWSGVLDSLCLAAPTPGWESLVGSEPEEL